MSLTFILILLLVIGVVFANIALLRFGSKPMPVPPKTTTSPAKTSIASGKAQAATAIVLPTHPTTAPEPPKSSNESGHGQSGSSNDGDAGGD